MNSLLDRVISIIKDENVLGPNMLRGREIDDVLDERDAESFDAEWTRVFKEVESRLKGLEIDQKGFDAIDLIRELSYKKAYSATGESELAGYVSDDFELISKAILVGYDEPWLTRLVQCYVSGEFPH